MNPKPLAPKSKPFDPNGLHFATANARSLEKLCFPEDQVMDHLVTHGGDILNKRGSVKLLFLVKDALTGLVRIARASYITSAKTWKIIFTTPDLEPLTHPLLIGNKFRVIAPRRALAA